GRDVLISAPTGSGKTLAAFLLCLDDLVRASRAGALETQVEMIYVSPLKALSNDIQKNLEAPLAEISAIAAEQGIPLPPIRTALRTGDTLVWDRQQMLKTPPHILVTTPESLFILLTAEKSREMLRTACAVIVDEIHAVADDKRGAHLALSLARLDRLAGRRLQRIGLSATVKPIELVARFLGEETRIVSVGHRRAMDLFVEVPKSELGVVASNEMWDEIYDRIADLIRARRTTLIFVNTRRLAERVSHPPGARLGAACACDELAADDLYALVGSAFPYRSLARKDFDAVIEMLSEGIAGAWGRRGAYLHRDQVNHQVRGRRGARLAAITSGGAIPENANYQVVAEPEGVVVGTLDEDFAVESMAGDIFLLGTTSWRIRRVEAGRVRVDDAHGAAPSIPFWT